MKKASIVATAASLILFFLSGHYVFGQSYEDSLTAKREHHDSLFIHTVLDSKEQAQLPGRRLHYFAPDRQFIVHATFTRIKGKKFAMPMSRERDKTVFYRKYGKLTFTLQDSVCELFVYENLELKNRKGFEDYLFLPFRDLTSGIDSYGGGRYMDLHIPADGNWIIDFNTAYHPYCAYSSRYSCPITPPENKLPVFVTAGEALSPSNRDH